MKGSDEAFSAESDDESDKEKDALALKELEAESDNALSEVSSSSDSESSGSKRIRRAYSVCLIRRKSRLSNQPSKMTLRAGQTGSLPAMSCRVFILRGSSDRL